jgi:hypothetical protein
MSFILLLISGCSLLFGDKDRPRTAKNTYYNISFHSSDWLEKKDQRSDYIFINSKDGRILLSNSFCDEFQELPLDQLAQKSFRTIKDFQTNSSDYTTYHHREAYRLQGSGLVDGVKVNLYLLNTRRDNCYFDFLAISPLETSSSKEIFEAFLDSVEFK